MYLDKEKKTQIIVNFNDGNVLATQYVIKKWSEIKSKTPSCRKRCVAPKRPLWKKMWNPRWRLRNGCHGRLMAKFLITTIQVNLVPIPSETWRRQHKFTWIVIIKIFTISLPSQPFLGCHLVFHIFFSQWPFWGCTFFYSWAVLD